MLNLSIKKSSEGFVQYCKDKTVLFGSLIRLVGTLFQELVQLVARQCAASVGKRVLIELNNLFYNLIECVT